MEMFEPESFDDFGDMVSSLRFGRAFVVKAPSERDLRRRLVDFLSGAAAASDAEFERVSSDMYALTWGNDPEALRDIVDQLLAQEASQNSDMTKPLDVEVDGPVNGRIKADVNGSLASERSAFGRPVVARPSR